MTATVDQRQFLLASPVRRAILDALTPAPGAPAPARSGAELAGVVGRHVTTVRFHLDRLVEAGLLTSRSERTPGAGRPRKLYSATAPPSAPATPEAAYRLLAELLTTTMADPYRPSATPDAAGREWAREYIAPLDVPPADTPGRWVGKAGSMVDVLRAWGYRPELRTTDDGRTVEVLLRYCPFAQLAKENPTVVCGIHRGLIRGAMEQFGEASARVTLDPFVEPDLCIARLTTHAPFRDPAAPDTRRTA